MRGTAMKIDSKNMIYRLISLHYFKKSKRAVEARRKTGRVYENDAVKKHVCEKGFTKCRCGDFIIKYTPHSACPTEIDSSDMKAIVDADPAETVREIATELTISHTSMKNLLRQLGCVSHCNISMPHKLTKAN